MVEVCGLNPANYSKVVALQALNKDWDELHKGGGLADLYVFYPEQYREKYKDKHGYYPNEKPLPKMFPGR